MKKVKRSGKRWREHEDRLTKRQMLLLIFLTNTIAERGFPPTIREVATNFGINASASLDRLKVLERKGFIVRHKGVSRGIAITNKIELLARLDGGRG